MPPDNNVQQEIEQLEQRHAENPDSLVFAHLADAYRKAGEFAKAEGLILHGLKKHPTYISAYNVLGRVYLEAERFADAHEQFNKVLELDPQNMIALRALGDLALEGGRLEDARSWYERILAIDPRNKEALDGLEMLKLGGAEGGEAAAVGVPSLAEPEIELEFDGGGLEGIDLEGVDFDIGDEEAEEAVLSLESDLPVGPEAEDEGGALLEAVEGLEPVEGLVNKETMTRSREEVARDPEVESASKLTQQEFIAGEPAEELPWEEMTGLDVLGGDAVAPEPDVVVGAGAAGDSFGESILEGLEAGDPMLPVSGEGEGVEIDLEELNDWTPGFLAEDDLTEEKGATLGEGAIAEEAAGEFSLDFGHPEVEPATEEERPAIGEGMVTETMAELFADQGLHEDALEIYRKLAEARPGDERLQKRIAELEMAVEESEGKSVTGLELDELLDLSEPRVPSDYAVDVPAVSEAVFEFEEMAEPEVPAVAPAPPEPADVTEPVFQAEPVVEAAPPPAPPPGDAESFAFADEAPVAGFEQLDPFAASFDVLVERDGQARPLVRAAEAETPEDGFEGPVPVTVDGVPLLESGVLPPGADIQPSPALASRERPAEPTLDRPATPEPLAAVGPEPVTVSGDGMTIEDYLIGLLRYDPEAPKAPKVKAPVAPTTEAEPEEGAGTEDLEQFQEWLKGLKS